MAVILGVFVLMFGVTWLLKKFGWPVVFGTSATPSGQPEEYVLFSSAYSRITAFLKALGLPTLGARLVALTLKVLTFVATLEGAILFYKRIKTHWFRSRSQPGSS